MSITDPQPLGALIAPWMTQARMRTAVFCAAAHPLDPAVLCSRLTGHAGLHVAGDGDDWTDEETTSG